MWHVCKPCGEVFEEPAEDGSCPKCRGPLEETSGPDELRQRIDEALRCLADQHAGTWVIQGQQIVNLAGYTHHEQLVVARDVQHLDAQGIVYCHNALPQLLTDLLEALNETTPTTLPPAIPG